MSQYAGLSDPMALSNLLRGTPAPNPLFSPVPLSGAVPPITPLPSALPPVAPAGGFGYFGPMGQPGLAGGMPAGGGAASTVAGSGGLLGRLPSLPKMNTSALSGKALLGRAGLGATIGSVGSSLIDSTDVGGQNSNWEQGAQGAAVGAGIGATVGAPLFGIGAVPAGLIGGAIGGGIGVLTNMFGGGGEEKEADPVEVLATAITNAGLDPAQSEQILATYETLMALAEGQEGDARAAAEQAAFDQTANLVLEAMQMKQQVPVAAADTLALQTAALDTFAPLAQDIRTNADIYAQTVGGIRDQLPESYRAVVDANVARETSSANKLADAYLAQAALTPIYDRLTQYQADNQAYASQLFQQALAQQSAGGMGGLGGGGQASVLDLLPAG